MPVVLPTSADRQTVWAAIYRHQRSGQAPRYSPIRALLQQAPAHGPRKWDFLHRLITGLVSPAYTNAKYDIVWDLLHTARADPEGPGAAPRYDPVYDLLHGLVRAAEWGLPQEGPVAAILSAGASDWEASR